MQFDQKGAAILQRKKVSQTRNKHITGLSRQW